MKDEMFISLCISLVMLPFIIWWIEHEDNYGHSEDDYYWNHKIEMLKRDIVAYKHELTCPSTFKYNHQLSSFKDIRVEKIFNELRSVKIEL